MINLIKVIITGRVQGVFFRDYTRRAALNLSLKGVVRNLPDGTVEVVIKGEEQSIKNFVKWCWKGSPSSKVLCVSVVELEDAFNFSSFDIKY